MRTVAALALAAAVSACSRAEYVDSGGAFHVGYKPTWKLSHELGAVVFRPPEGRGSVAVTAAPRDGGLQPRTLAAVLPALLGEYRTLANFRLRSDRSQPLDGVPGFLLDATFDRAGTSWRRRQHVVESKRFIVYFDCNAPVEAFDAFEPTCKAIEETLRVEEE